MQDLKKEIVLFEDGKKNLELRRKFNRLLTGGMNLIKTLRGHSGSVLSVSFSSDSSKVASGGAEGAVKLWDVESGEVIRTLEGHSDYVSSNPVSFSPDGTKIASGSRDMTIKIWEDTRVQERRREMKEMMRSLYKANRRTRDRDGNYLPSEAGRKLYDPNIGRKIGEFL